jgi:hypothetical protein
LEGVKAGMLEIANNIQCKFDGSTRHLEEFIERFHTEMKVKEESRNAVSICIFFNRKCLKSP